MHEALKKLKTPREKAEMVWNHYLQRKLQTDLEPEWTHPAYDILDNYLKNQVKKEDIRKIVDVIKTHEIPDGWEVKSLPNKPQAGTRIIHDGWKVGSPTWVFMGRNLHPDATHYLGHDWVATCREVPPDIYELFDPSIPNLVWIAYHRKLPMELSSQKNCVGPAIFYDTFIEALEKQIGKKLPENPDPRMN